MPYPRVQISNGDEIRTNHNRFVIVQRYREGGNAVSFVAFCHRGPLAGIPCVLKVFDNLEDRGRFRHFLAEADLLQSLDHPAILRVIDTGDIQQPFREELITYHFHVTRLYGTNLLQRLRECAPLPERLITATQLLSAVRYLANLDDPIIHRDIKPANIFIEAGTCVLGDFGLFIRQSALDAALTDDEARVAIARGMAGDYRIPDLLQYGLTGEPVSSRANVYQAGLVLCEIFTGSRVPMRANAAPDPDRLGRVAGRHGKSIRAALIATLDPSASTRISIDDALEGFTSIARDLSIANVEINGRLF